MLYQNLIIFFISPAELYGVELLMHKSILTTAITVSLILSLFT